MPEKTDDSIVQRLLGRSIQAFAEMLLPFRFRGVAWRSAFNSEIRMAASTQAARPGDAGVI